MKRKLNLFIVIFLCLLAFLTCLCFGLSFIYKNIYQESGGVWYVANLQPSYYVRLKFERI